MNHTMRPIGILPSHRPSYIDHLVPLCHLFQAPLLVTSREIQHTIEHYYPSQKVLLAEPRDYDLNPFLEPYTLFLYVDLFRLATGSFWFADYHCSLKRRSLCALHGHSEKAWKIFRFERFCDEDRVLLYGESWKTHLQNIGVWERLKNPIICGNYRLSYYKKFRSFFQKKIENEIAHCQNKKLILYAPTWSGTNYKTELSYDYSPFLEVLPSLVSALPQKWHLCIKIHSHFAFLHSEMMEELKKFESTQVTFLTHLPLIYPLLEHVDIFIGDYSSIGYDFLYFLRPLYFCCPPREGSLYESGKFIAPDQLKEIFKRSDDLKEKQSSLYKEAFGTVEPDLDDLKQKIVASFL